MVNCFIEAGFDVASADRVKKQDEDGGTLFACRFSCFANETDKLGGSLERGFRCVHEIKGYFDGEKRPNVFQFTVH